MLLLLLELKLDVVNFYEIHLVWSTFQVAIPNRLLVKWIFLLDTDGEGNVLEIRHTLG